ncbi:MAG: lipid hydroperoxide peroxidase [Bacteroidetes bacterium]|nr:MAG: lipid hydroperoxide peroxidase [Bacteroidota bacterium]
MAKITLQGHEFNTNGDLPKIGEKAPNFKLTKTDLSDAEANHFEGKKVILNIFPSLDTPVCAASTRKFNQEAANLDNTVVLCISKDLPFAHGRFCSTEGIENVVSLSQLKSSSKFAEDYGVLITDGPMENLMARAVVVLNEKNEVVYTELVPEITQEPNYEAALKSL